MRFKDWPTWLKIVNSICTFFIIIGIGYFIYEILYCSITQMCDWGPFGSIILFLPMAGIFLGIFLFGTIMNYLLNKKTNIGKYVIGFFLIASILFINYMIATIGNHYSFGEWFIVLITPLLCLTYTSFIAYLFVKKSPIKNKFTITLAIFGFLLIFLPLIFRGRCVKLIDLFHSYGCATTVALVDLQNFVVSFGGAIVGAIIGKIIDQIKFKKK